MILIKNNYFLFLFNIYFLSSCFIYAQFGKNKIISERIKWHILKTPHFDIYHDSKNKEIAKLAAKITEKASAILSKRLEHSLTEIIPIIIFNSPFSFANNNIAPEILGEETGGFTESLANRIVVPYTGKLDEFYHVLIHELTHAFQFNILFGNIKGINLIKNFLPQPPLWVMEGTAEHFALGSKRNVEMYERDGIITGSMPSIEEMDNLYLLGNRYYYIYKGGQSVFNWISKTYGEGKVADFFHNIALYTTSEKACQKTFGMDLSTLSKKWHRYLKEKYWIQIKQKKEAIEIDEQHTSHSKDMSSINLSPIFGKDNNILYFFTNKKIYSQIVRYNILRKRITKIIATAEKDNRIENINFLNGTLSIGQKKENLLFISKKIHRFFFNIYSIRKEKIIQRIPIKAISIFQAKLSPDKTKIVFAATIGINLDIFIYHIKLKKIEKITSDKFTDVEPCWSPDGKKIAFSSNRDFDIFSSKRNIYIYDIDSKKLSVLSFSDSRDYSPSWSPDGKKIMFSSDRRGGPDIYIKNLETKILYQITDTTGGANSPSWSPDGKRICYTGFHKGGFDIFTAKLNMQNTNFVKKMEIEKFDKSPEIIKKPSIHVLKNSKMNDFYFDTKDISIKKNFPLLIPHSLYFVLTANSAAGFGTRIIMSAKDILNNHQLYIDTDLSYNSDFDIFDTETSINLFILKNRWQYGFRLYFFQENVLIYKGNKKPIKNPNSFYNLVENKLGIGSLFRYPIDKYNRFDFATIPTYFQRKHENVDKDFLTNKNYQFNELQAFATILTVSFVHDSTLIGHWHPVDNKRSLFQIDGSPHLGKYSLSYVRVFMDIRQYFLLTRWSSFAFRFMAGHALGKSKNEFRFRIGGGAIHSNYPYIRGYPLRAFSGSTMYLLNIEYRSVILDFARFAFPFKYQIKNISGILFFDIGTAFDNFENHSPWNTKEGFEFTDLKASFGFGIRFFLFIFPFKIDFSSPIKKNGLNHIRDWETFISLGFDF